MNQRKRSLVLIDPITRRVMVSREVKFVESKGYYEEKKWEDLEDLSRAPSEKATTLRVLLERLGIGLSQDQEPGRTGPSNQTGEAGGTTPLDHERGNGSIQALRIIIKDVCKH